MTKILTQKAFQLILRMRDMRQKKYRSLKFRFVILRDKLRVGILLLIIKINKKRIDNLEYEFIINCYQYRNKAKGQIFQDIFALTVNNFKNNGYFVEFGATDGIKLSNTFILETDFFWSGILAEPGMGWKKELRKNRHVNIDDRCVYSKTGEIIKFTQFSDGQMSGISELVKIKNEQTKSYEVKTVSLIDLLKQYNAPQNIDFISIDTEGSEYIILKNFDFTKYQLNCLAIEHNFDEVKREKIKVLLEKNSYKQILKNFSSHDDWFIKSA
jgi:FkbM family methyltransferase